MLLVKIRLKSVFGFIALILENTHAVFEVKVKMANDEDEDMESFDVDDLDLEYALNPLARKKMTKNQQLYGMSKFFASICTSYS